MAVRHNEPTTKPAQGTLERQQPIRAEHRQRLLDKLASLTGGADRESV